LLAVAQGAALASPSAASADDVCAAPERLFAVEGDTGHLSEVEACPETGSMSVVAEVDTGYWGYPLRVFAAAAGPVTVVYAVTADGRLQARRQDAPGLPLGSPVDVGAGVDWTASWVFSPGPGFVALSGHDARVFRHVGWDSGGENVVEGPPLIDHYGDWPATGDISLIGLRHGGPASGFFMSHHWRITRNEGRMLAWPSGAINREIHSVTGAEPTLYGVRQGAVVRLAQPRSSEYPTCHFNPNSWSVVGSLPGDWRYVVAPARTAVTGDWPVMAGRANPFPARASVAQVTSARPPPTGPQCPDNIGPYKWQ
jgi:hypothetical protein